MTITTSPQVPELPTPPSSADPSNFDARADAFLDALPQWGQTVSTVGQAAKANAEHAQAQAEAASTQKEAAANSAAAAANARDAAANSATAAAGSKDAAATSATTAANAASVAVDARDAANQAKDAAAASAQAAADSAAQAAGVVANGVIDDSQVASNRAWSSQKTHAEIDAAATAAANAAAPSVKQSGNGPAMTFNWQGQSGQPQWVWGGNDDGTSLFVWNPANFSVNHATTSNGATAQWNSAAINSSSSDTNASAVIRNAGGGGDGAVASLGLLAQGTYGIKLNLRNDGVCGFGGWSRAPWSWYTDHNGNMVAAGNVTAYSDPRLKRDFQRVGDPLAILSKLDGGTFTWRHDIPHIAPKAGKRDYGVLADQVKAVMPEIVSPSVEIDGEVYDTVSYEKLVPVLIEAVKELHGRIKELEGR